MSKTKHQIEQNYWLEYMDWLSKDVNWSTYTTNTQDFWKWLLHVKMPKMSESKTIKAWEEL